MSEEPDEEKLVVIREYLGTKFDGLQWEKEKRPHAIDYELRFRHRGLDYSLTVPRTTLTKREIEPATIKDKLVERDVASKLRYAQDRTYYWEM